MLAIALVNGEEGEKGICSLLSLSSFLEIGPGTQGGAIFDFKFAPRSG
jgi:hypothetical protein